jgi:hypothetical protein
MPKILKDLKPWIENLSTPVTLHKIDPKRGSYLVRYICTLPMSKDYADSITFDLLLKFGIVCLIHRRGISLSNSNVFHYKIEHKIVKGSTTEIVISMEQNYISLYDMCLKQVIRELTRGADIKYLNHNPTKIFQDVFDTPDVNRDFLKLWDRFIKNEWIKQYSTTQNDKSITKIIIGDTYKKEGKETSTNEFHFLLRIETLFISQIELIGIVYIILSSDEFIFLLPFVFHLFPYRVLQIHFIVIMI